jgi:hypothetical protein
MWPTRLPALRVIGVVVVLCVAPIASAAAPVLRSADARIEMHAPGRCEVALTVDLGDAARVEHRIEVVENGRVELIALHGAVAVGEPRTVGRTRALVLEPAPGASPYTLRYIVEQPSAHEGRCPLWIPTIPTEGGGRPVRLVATLPAGATPVGTMPLFAWDGHEGTAVLAHLPAFVRLPYALPGMPSPRDVARMMDIVSVVALAGATIAWARRRRA